MKNRDNLYILGAVIIMVALYVSSSMPYSDQSLISPLANILPTQPFNQSLSRVSFLYAGEEVSVQTLGYYNFIEFFLRKFAHFMIYFVLGSFWFLGLRSYVSRKHVIALIALGLTVGYAAFDEMHQMFTAERSGLFQDVLLDSFGGLTGIALTWFNSRTTRRRSRRR